MTSAALKDFERLCLHTITTRPWTLREAIQNYREAGIPSITVWRDALTAAGLAESAAMLRDSGLNVISLCRGGFFPATTAAGRQTGIDDNLLAIEQAHAIGAPLIVLVCGAVPGQSLETSRKQIAEGIAAIASRAAQANVKLAIEPLHPMYADSRSAVNTLRQANDMVEQLGLANVGVTIDVYHLWWDPELQSQIARAGAMNTIFSYHVCDWRTPTRDLLNDRELMGRGCIPLRDIRSWVESTGFSGAIEVEIFSDEYWSQDQYQFVQSIKSAYLDFV